MKGIYKGRPFLLVYLFLCLQSPTIFLTIQFLQLAHSQLSSNNITGQVYKVNFERKEKRVSE